MDFGLFLKIWAVVMVLAAIVVIGGQFSNNNFLQANILMGCEDYTYNVELNVIPTHMDIYTTETGTAIPFKTDDVTAIPFGTILHCGHSYKIVYSSPGYKDYVEEFNVGKYISVKKGSENILQSEINKINLIQEVK